MIAALFSSVFFTSFEFVTESTVRMKVTDEKCLVIDDMMPFSLDLARYLLCLLLLGQ